MTTKLQIPSANSLTTYNMFYRATVPCYAECGYATVCRLSVRL